MAEVLEVINRALGVLEPPPEMTVSEWADDRRYVSPSVSSYPGQWQTERVPYMREIMDCCNDPQIETITVMKASRMAVTEALINNRIGYNVDLDPRSMLYVQQNLGEARKYSDLILKPLIEDTPVIANKAFQGTKDTNTKLIKTFRGCSLVLVGAKTSTGFRMIDALDVYCDDIDGADYAIGPEGDKVDLAIGRGDNVPEGYLKNILVSSPTIKKHSRIEKWFDLSDKRYNNVPCPHCDAGQILKWGGKDKDFGFKWTGRDPETTYYLCEHCHKPIYEWHKDVMMNQGIWIPTAEFHGNAGFHISRFYSLFIPWKKTVRKFLDAGTNPGKLQVVVNTCFGETFERKSRTIESDTLYGRREMYGPLVPNEAPILTAGIDVQDNRVECEVVAWGKGEESWGMGYKVFWGDTTKPKAWDDLDKFLLTPLHNGNGNSLYILGIAIDYAFRPKQVASFVRPRQKRTVAQGVEQRIIATRGANKPGKPIIADKPFSDENIGKMQYYWIGTDTAKDTISAYLSQKKNEFGPGYMHFPAGNDDEGFEGRDEVYFKQLTSEKVFEVTDKYGETTRRWEKKDDERRNEALDCRVYALAALMHLVNNHGLNLDLYVSQVLELIDKKQKGLIPAKPAGRRVISKGINKDKYYAG